jgi:hypothetical protein
MKSTSTSRVIFSFSPILYTTMLTFCAFVALSTLALAAPRSKRAADCTATVSSLDDADGASDCTTVNINGFTVPAGEGFELDLADGSTVNLSKMFIC